MKNENFFSFIYNNYFIPIIAIFMVFYPFYLLLLWYSDKQSFWKHFFIGIGIIITLIFIFLLFKKLSKKRKENLIKDINILGLNNDINNFINRAGIEKGKDAWKYIGYGFNIDKMKIFIKTLKEKGLKIKEINDLEYILKVFIDNKEESIIKGGFSFNENKFSSLSGTEFENLLIKLFESINYVVEHPGSVGDQGGDLILNKDGERILIQAKCYTNNIGNQAVQQAVAAKKYYDCGRAMVIGTADFTREAVDLARANNVELMKKKQLQELLLLHLNQNWT
ncbi:MAG TPA: restriction endonuclease [Candidatus Pacearchaeota archaeon]|nr:restriction endonuclease [Candidatus Pacearchaeota archaeon]